MASCQMCEGTKKNEARYAVQYMAEDTPTITLLGNHFRGFPLAKVCSECLNIVHKETEMGFPRRLTAEEMFNIPDWWKQERPTLDGGWENPDVSTKHYYPSICVIWEVSERAYNRWKEDGGYCQKYQNRFYIA